MSFIQFAEKTGFIRELTGWMIERCAAAPVLVARLPEAPAAARAQVDKSFVMAMESDRNEAQGFYMVSRCPRPTSPHRPKPWSSPDAMLGSEFASLTS